MISQAIKKVRLYLNTQIQKKVVLQDQWYYSCFQTETTLNEETTSRQNTKSVFSASV